jgi:hypothetical protein
MRFVKSLLWFVPLAALGSGVAPASAADADKKDVTITVVDDPDQLTEKVNTISLPAADDEHSEAPAKRGKEAARGKAAEHDTAAEHGKQAHDAAENANNDAEDTKHDAGRPAQGDVGASKQDANDAKQEEQDAQHPNDTRST